jgi:hypothetical protein
VRTIHGAHNIPMNFQVTRRARREHHFPTVPRSMSMLGYTWYVCITIIMHLLALSNPSRDWRCRLANRCCPLCTQCCRIGLLSYCCPLTNQCCDCCQLPHRCCRLTSRAVHLLTDAVSMRINVVGFLCSVHHLSCVTPKPSREPISFACSPMSASQPVLSPF